MVVTKIRRKFSLSLWVRVHICHFFSRLTISLGVIKGSERALKTKVGYLSREDYNNMSRRIGAFVTERDAVYELFEVYLKVKRGRGEYDAADRTHRIYSRYSVG